MPKATTEQPAKVIYRPVYHNDESALAFFFVLGLLLGFIAATFRNWRNNSAERVAALAQVRMNLELRNQISTVNHTNSQLQARIQSDTRNQNHTQVVVQYPAEMMRGAVDQQAMIERVVAEQLRVSALSQPQQQVRSLPQARQAYALPEAQQSLDHIQEAAEWVPSRKTS